MCQTLMLGADDTVLNKMDIILSLGVLQIQKQFQFRNSLLTQVCLTILVSKQIKIMQGLETISRYTARNTHVLQTLGVSLCFRDPKLFLLACPTLQNTREGELESTVVGLSLGSNERGNSALFFIWPLPNREEPGAQRGNIPRKHKILRGKKVLSSLLSHLVTNVSVSFIRINRLSVGT